VGEEVKARRTGGKGGFKVECIEDTRKHDEP